MRYKSRLEVDFAKRFQLPYEQQRLAYTIVHHYTPDWFVAPNVAIETKGLWTATDRSKMLHIKTQHPGFKVLMVFSHPNKTLSKASITTYAQWCDKHGMPWCAATDHQAIHHFIQNNS